MAETQLPHAWQRLRADERRRHVVLHHVRSTVWTNGALAPVESAKVVGLRYVSDARMPGIRRIGAKKRFRYVAPNGRRLTDPAALQRIQALAIVPAWTDVWICPDPRGHLQATGRDARGRKQYRYHPEWRVVRDEVKYGRMIAFSEALPRVRARTEADLRAKHLSRERVLAAV